MNSSKWLGVLCVTEWTLYWCYLALIWVYGHCTACKFEGLMVYKRQVFCFCVVAFIFEMGGACGACWRQERCIQCFGGEMWGKESLERSRHSWEDNIKMDLQDVGWGGMGWIDWLRTGSGSWCLWMWQWTFRFHNMQGVCWLAEDLLGLCSMELFIYLFS